MSTLAPTAVRFLSQNRPGPHMGMGLYERLLWRGLHAAADPAQWRFEVVFDGRAKGLALEPAAIAPGLAGARFAGFSCERTLRWPWWLAERTTTWLSKGPWPDLFHSLALGLPGPRHAPALYTIHDLPPAHFPDEGFVPRWAKAAMRAAWGVAVPSAWAKGELMEQLDLPSEKVHVVPYGCEHERFHAGVEPADAARLVQLGITGEFLVYSGGFTRRKNVAAMLEAWKAIAPQYPQLSLALLGPKDDLANFARAAGAPRVVVAGYVGRDDMPRVLKAARGLVCPSIYEGFGLPPLEAMALGVPVIAVNATAVREVTAGHATLAATGSAEDLAAALRQFLEDPEEAQRLVAGGLRRVQDFHWPKHAQTILGLYRQMGGAA